MNKTPQTKETAPKRTGAVVAKTEPAIVAKKPAVPVKTAVAKPKAVAAKSTALPAAKKSVVAKAAPKQTAKPVAEEKIKKPKLVRDSFTMPEAEYQVLDDVKKACIKAGVAVKKSELLRVGVALIKSLDHTALKAALAALMPLKAGRPKNGK